ncbi:MAG: hypothetical protein AB7E55_20410 [Pigmentiphaga sp.]
MTRVRLDVGTRTLVATLNVVVDDQLGLDEVALSEIAWTLLDPMPGALTWVRHAEPAGSAGALRANVSGAQLDDTQYLALMQNVRESTLSDLELAAFVKASAGYRLPKTPSRAITSPAGTADTMEVMAPVALDLAAMRQVVEREDGCIVWGGNVRQHRVERLQSTYRIPVGHVSATPAVARWIAETVPDAMLIGPDSESKQWVAGIAAAASTLMTISCDSPEYQ